MSTINKIFEEALIKEKDNYYSFKPIVVGDYLFDASVIDHYKKDIVKNLGIVRVKEKPGKDIYKIIVLYNALFKLDRNQNYTEAYNYKKLDQEINSILSFTDYTALVKDENTIYVIDNKSGEYVEATLNEHEDETSTSYTFSFILNNIMVDVKVTLSKNGILYKYISVIDKNTMEYKSLEYSDDYSFLEMVIRRFSDRLEEIIIEQYEEEFSVQIDSREKENEYSPNYCDGDINRYLVVAGGKKPSIDMGEQSFLEDDILQNGILLADGIISITNSETCEKSNFENVDEYYKDANAEEEYNCDEIEITDKKEFSEIFLSVMRHPRNAELIERALDIGDENLYGIKRFVKENYKNINNCLNSINDNKITNSVINKIHNPVCDFGDKELFNGFGKTK